MAGQWPRSRPGLQNFQFPILSSIRETSLNQVQSVEVPLWIRLGSVLWSWPVVSGTRALVADPLSSVDNEIGPDRCLTGLGAGQGRPDQSFELFIMFPWPFLRMIIVIHLTCQGFSCSGWSVYLPQGTMAYLNPHCYPLENTADGWQESAALMSLLNLNKWVLKSSII